MTSDQRLEASDTLSGDPLADAFIGRILTGLNPPGSRLTERQITDVAGCSHARAREVLHQLEKAGAVRIFRNRGAVVFGRDDADPREVDLIWDRMTALLEGLAGRRLPLDASKDMGVAYTRLCRAIDRLGDEADDRKLAGLLKRLALHRAVLSMEAA